MGFEPKEPADRLIVALDVPDRRSAIKLLDWVPEIRFVKVGSVLFGADGPKILRELTRRGLRVFLDLKLHDIPNTVAGAVRSLCDHGPLELLTIHAGGGKGMIEAARKAADEVDAGSRPTIVAVTVLTSLSQADFAPLGIAAKSTEDQVTLLGKLAINAGADGVVCSPQEVESLRHVLPKTATLVVPGIRPKAAGGDDQKRTATAGEALARGATYLVVGRPIIEAEKPRDAFLALCAELSK